MKRFVGTLSEIWRYPVKSMLGERLSELAIGDACILYPALTGPAPGLASFA
jgi:hypothetical protein